MKVNLTGAQTGRLDCSKPNLSNKPKPIADISLSATPRKKKKILRIVVNFDGRGVYVLPVDRSLIQRIRHVEKLMKMHELCQVDVRVYVVRAELAEKTKRNTVLIDLANSVVAYDGTRYECTLRLKPLQYSLIMQRNSGPDIHGPTSTGDNSTDALVEYWDRLGTLG